MDYIEFSLNNSPKSRHPCRKYFSGLQKYYYLRSDDEKKILVTTTIFLLTIFLSLIAIFILVISRNISLLLFDTEQYYIAIGILGFCLPIENLFNSLLLLLRLNRKAINFSFVNIRIFMFLNLGYYVIIIDKLT